MAEASPANRTGIAGVQARLGPENLLHSGGWRLVLATRRLAQQGIDLVLEVGNGRTYASMGERVSRNDRDSYDRKPVEENNEGTYCDVAQAAGRGREAGCDHRGIAWRHARI